MKWGIMATGSIAQKFASTVNRMTDEGEILQAVASRTKESAENFARQHRIPEVFDSYKAMAESDSVDVIYIATPNNMHYENVKMCLLAGKTRSLRKMPFTTSAAQAAGTLCAGRGKRSVFNGRFLDSFSSGFTENAGTHQGGKVRRNPLYPFRIWICCKRGQKSAQV